MQEAFGAVIASGDFSVFDDVVLLRLSTTTSRPPSRRTQVYRDFFSQTSTAVP